MGPFLSDTRFGFRIPRSRVGQGLVAVGLGSCCTHTRTHLQIGMYVREVCVGMQRGVWDVLAYFPSCTENCAVFVAEEEEVQDLDEFGALLLCTSMLQP